MRLNIIKEPSDLILFFSELETLHGRYDGVWNKYVSVEQFKSELMASINNGLACGSIDSQGRIEYFLTVAVFGDSASMWCLYVREDIKPESKGLMKQLMSILAKNGCKNFNLVTTDVRPSYLRWLKGFGLRMQSAGFTTKL